MKKVYQIRKEHENENISFIIVIEKGKFLFQCFLLELLWKDNITSKSCIEAKRYILKKREANENGSRFNYPHFEVLNVKDRLGIKWHRANHVRQLLGCGAPGLELADIDNDGNIDVTSSTIALETLWNVLDDENELIIFTE